MKKSFQLASFKALDGGQGLFEAIVAVFGNVDRGGDKILPGAFADTLAAWQEKGMPIPVIFAHQWDNLDAHIGQVLEAKEVDEGLYVKGQLEMDEPFAARVWKKMSKGLIKEFSFAYDVRDSAVVKQDGELINELRKLDLFEVGPCLVGMNPDTQLLGVKEQDGETGRQGDGEKADDFNTVIRRDQALRGLWEEKWQIESALEQSLESIIGDASLDTAGKVAALQTSCEQFTAALVAWMGKAIAAGYAESDDLKATGPEWFHEMLKRDLGQAAARGFNEGWEAFLADRRGEMKEGRRNSGADSERIQGIHDLTCELGAKCVANEGSPEGEAGKDGKPSGKVGPSIPAARVAMELMELGVG